MTIKELLARAVAQYGQDTAVRFKHQGQWHSWSYEELQQRAENVAEWLHRIGLGPEHRIALCLDNCAEWFEIYLGITGLGATAVPIDPKLREQEIAHILHDSGAVGLFAHNRHYPVMQTIMNHLPDLQHIAFLEASADLPDSIGRASVYRYPAMRDALEQPETERTAYSQCHPTPDSLASLIYTSGTTGRPKGAMLTHRNFTTDILESLKVIPSLNHDDNFLVVLPLHHAYAFTAGFLAPLACGAQLSLVENLRTIRENVIDVQPTVFIGVPLLFEKMFTRLQEALKKKPAARWLMRLGLKHIVTKKVRAGLGGKLRLMISGGAPCDPNIIHGWQGLGVSFVEGYGLTECAPIVCLNPVELNHPGSIGKPIPNIEVDLLDRNEEGVGEIAVRGDIVTQGYFNQPKATEEAFRDGWFLTGDLGRQDADGFVYIAGRKKALIVNREGKNIYPEEVELCINAAPGIQEGLVLGFRDPDTATGEKTGAIVVPDQEYFDEYADRKKTPLSDEDIIQMVQQAVRKQCENLAAYKRPRLVQVRFEEFEKTSTGKIKRYLYAIDSRQADTKGDE